MTEPRTCGRRARPPGPGGRGQRRPVRTRLRAAAGPAAGAAPSEAPAAICSASAGPIRPAALRTADQAGRRGSGAAPRCAPTPQGARGGQGEAMPAVSRFQAAAVGSAVYIHTHRSLDDVLVLDASDPGAPKLASRPVTGAQGTPMSRRGPCAERRLCTSARLCWRSIRDGTPFQRPHRLQVRLVDVVSLHSRRHATVRSGPCTQSLWRCALFKVLERCNPTTYRLQAQPA